MTITEQEAAKVARLSRLAMDTAELKRRTDSINGILGWIEQLNEVNVDGVEPLQNVASTHLQLREDKITDGNYTDEILKNAPEETQGFFVVPKVVE